MSNKQIYLKIAEAIKGKFESESRLSWYELGTLFTTLAAQEPEPVVERWRPTYGEIYWTPAFQYARWKATSITWRGDEADERIFNAGFCYKTQAEAGAKTEELRKLTGLK